MAAVTRDKLGRPVVAVTGIGMTDLVKRPTRTPEEIERQEFAEGRVLLAQKLEELRPRVVAFNGKMVYEKFTGRTCKLGLQKEKLYGSSVFVLPSTAGLKVTTSTRLAPASCPRVTFSVRRAARRPNPARPWRRRRPA